MAVRLYIGGTAGNKDGKAISQGDMSNPFTFNGYDIESGSVKYAQYAKAYLRADEGEEWVGVCLKIADISGSEDLHDSIIIGQTVKDQAGTGQIDKTIAVGPNAFFLEGDLPERDGDDITNTNGAFALFFPYVSDVNSDEACLYMSPLLYIGLKDPHASIKIIMTGGACSNG